MNMVKTIRGTIDREGMFRLAFEPSSMKTPSNRMRGTVWRYSGKAGSWHFITLPKKQADYIKEQYADLRCRWGSIRVLVTIGKTSFKTSIFPDSKSGSYVLPLKASVRKKEGVREGKTIAFQMNIE